MRNSRTLGRLVWFHVPPRLTAKTEEEIKTGQLQRSPEEQNKVMAEKRMALDLIEGCVPGLRSLLLLRLILQQICRFPEASHSGSDIHLSFLPSHILIITQASSAFTMKTFIVSSYLCMM